MSKSIEDRVVGLEFNNQGFEKGIKTTLDSLNLLNKGLKLEGAADGINDVNKSVDGTSSKFTALQAVAFGVFASIGAKAADLGLSIVKNLTLDPILDGFGEYELKMGSIQTILANTSRAGTTLDEVSDAFGRLNEYADKTIYNFGDMTKNIGLFTNAGIGLQDATDMIQGFSNEAASSGVTATGAAGAAYQLSQALSAGMIRLMDWRSLTNVGMGSENMKRGLTEIADAMGTFIGTQATAESAMANFNASLEEQWLTAEVMSTYLKIQAGVMSDEQMRAIGLTNEQIEAFKKQQQIAEDAATKVRTFTQLAATVKESVGSSWAETFEIFIGDFNQATDFWTDVNNQLEALLGPFGTARNEMLAAWADMGGRDDVMNSITNVLKAINSLITPVREAFQEIFGTFKQAEGLKSFTQLIETFTSKLVLSGGAMESLKKIFKGVFAVFDIVFTTLKVIGKSVMAIINPIIGALGLGGGSILDFVGNIGSWFVSLNESFQKSKFVTDTAEYISKAVSKVVEIIKELAKQIRGFFGNDVSESTDSATENVSTFQTVMEKTKDVLTKVGTALKPVIDWFKAFGSVVGSVFSAAADYVGKFFGVVSDVDLDSVTNSVGKLAKVGEALKAGWDNVAAFFTKIWDLTKGVGTAIKDGIQSIWNGITKGISEVDPNIAAGTLNLGLATAFSLIVKKIIDSLNPINWDDLREEITDTMDRLRGVLAAYQADIMANALIKIAVAIAVLAGSVLLIAQMPAASLAAGAAALGVLGAVLVTMMKSLDKALGDESWKKLPAVAASMLLMSGAMLLLSTAAKKLAELDVDAMAAGVAAVTAMMLSTRFVGTAKADFGTLIGIAISFNILAMALKKFEDISWETLAKGGVTLAALIGALKLIELAKINGENMVRTATSLTILGAALYVFAGAISRFKDMDSDEFWYALQNISISLLLLVAALRALPEKDMVRNSAALIIMSSSLFVLAGALEVFMKMESGDYTKAIIMVAGALATMAGVLRLLEGNISGAAALMVLVVALSMLAPVILKLGNTDWKILALGIGAMVVGLAALGAVALLMSSAVPILLGLAAAVVLLGGAVFLAGAGIGILATGLASLAAVGVGGAMAIGLVMSVIADKLPEFAKAVGQAFVAFILEVGKSGDALIETATSIILSLIESLRAVMPPLLELLYETLDNLLTGLLNLVEERLPDWIEAGGNIIVSWLEGMEVQLPRIVEAGAKLIATYLNELANHMPEVMESATNLITTFLEELANNLPDIILAGTDVIVAFIEGIGAQALAITTAAGDTLITFMEGIEQWIRDNSQRFTDAGWDIAEAIIDGAAGGITGGIDRVVESAKGMANSVVGAVEKVLGIFSPSRVMRKLGGYTTEGFAIGLGDNGSMITDATNKIGNKTIEGLKDALKYVTEVGVDSINLDPTITPIIDLTNIQGAKSKIEDYLNIHPINVDGATANAAVVASAFSDYEEAKRADSKSSNPSFSYTQVINSPKAVSNGEIYRRTNSLLSTVRKDVKPTNDNED